MKKTIFIIALFIFIKPIAPVLDYIINYDYISNELCQNKETPVLGCDGKCYLMSQLAKSSEDEKPISGQKNIVKDVEVLFFQEIKYVFFQKPFLNTNHSINSNYSNLYSYLSNFTFFHPPANIS